MDWVSAAAKLLRNADLNGSTEPVDNWRHFLSLRPNIILKGNKEALSKSSVPRCWPAFVPHS